LEQRCNKIGIKVSPIYKREERNKLRNYKGIILMDTVYKVYASLKKLEKKTEEKLREIV